MSGMKSSSALTASLMILCPTSALAEKLTYPESKRVDQVDILHGVKVPDPYRWLEDDKSEDVQKWVEAQAKFADDYLGKLPRRKEIEERLTKLWNFEKHGLPLAVGGRLFYTRNSGLQNQSVLYWREDEDAATQSMLLDPNTLAADGTAALSGYAVSDDGKLLAYGISRSGSDWQEWKVRSVDSGKDLADLLEDVKFSGASWTNDHKSFCYSRYLFDKKENRLKAENVNQKLYLHKVGDPQAKDQLLYERPDQPKWMFDGHFTEDGRFLVIDVSPGASAKNGLFYRDLSQPDAPVVELLKDFDAKYAFVANDGPVFFIQTDRDAPAGRLIAIDTTKPEPAHWKTIIAERKEALQAVSEVGGRFFASYLKDVLPLVRVHDHEGAFLSEVAMPEIGTASGFGGRHADKSCFYAMTGFTNAGRIYRYDLPTGKSEPFWEAKTGFAASDYETRQVFATSKDGTKVPLFLTHKKGLEPKGEAPVFLYAYGGFDISLTPSFSVANAEWVEMGGVFAVANLRGGGEYGKTWHEAGMKTKKQNVFDDFIAAAEWLVANKITNPKKLAIGGGSNGGLLTAACLNQRPDLYGAVWTAVGVQDMLRFHKFTIGWAWQDEYGNVDKEEDFKNLFGYSPYHNVKPGTKYPPVLITTADHDDRVFPAHSFKYGAAMQAAQGGEAPIILSIETKAGHGAGKPTSKAISEAAERLAFFAASLGM